MCKKYPNISFYKFRHFFVHIQICVQQLGLLWSWSSYINFIKELLMFSKILSPRESIDIIRSKKALWCFEFQWHQIGLYLKMNIQRQWIDCFECNNKSLPCYKIFVLAKLIMVQGGNYNGLKLPRIFFQKVRILGNNRKSIQR